MSDPNAIVSTMIECPRHEGSFDCTPFCNICEGNQEYDPADEFAVTMAAIVSEGLARIDSLSDEELEAIAND